MLMHKQLGKSTFTNSKLERMLKQPLPSFLVISS